MPEPTLDEINARIAAWVGDEGFEWCGMCPNGHSLTFHLLPTEPCPTCGEPAGRGAPKPYSSDLNLLAPVVEAWCRDHGADWGIGCDGGDSGAQIFMYAGDGRPYEHHSENHAEALARALSAALEGENDERTVDLRAGWSRPAS